ncbi:MAG: hypothetical protein OXH22_13700 [Chloroflexi bacterium]|nr:hypothetical protein [Chloroflexota bacterium]
MTLDIHNIVQGLAVSRPIFHSEADFQFALAWHIKKMMPECEVRLEFKPFSEESMFLDIWLPTIGTVIELKYIRSRIDLEYAGECFSLKEGASDIERYDFLKDVSRIERVVANREGANQGYSILLTNSPSCWEQPSTNKKPTIFEAFRIHEGRCIKSGEVLAWRANSKPGNERENPIVLTAPYHMRWQDYSVLGSQRNSQFRYLAVSVID